MNTVVVINSFLGRYTPCWVDSQELCCFACCVESLLGKPESCHCRTESLKVRVHEESQHHHEKHELQCSCMRLVGVVYYQYSLCFKSDHPDERLSFI